MRSADVQDCDVGVDRPGASVEFESRFHQAKVFFADRTYGRNNLPESVRTASGCLLQTVLSPVNTCLLVTRHVEIFALDRNYVRHRYCD